MQGRNDFAFGAFGRLLEYRTEQIPFIAYEGVYVELSYNPSDIFCGQLPQWYLRDALSAVVIFLYVVNTWMPSVEAR